MTSIDHIDLNLLRVFHAIVEEQSLTRAGVRLGLSQPAISYSLGRLRTLFDDPLFVRTRSSMQPTPIALELAGIVGQALDTVRDALRYAERFDPATSTRTFRISLSDAGELAYLPLICEALHEQAPNVRLHVLPAPMDEIAELLRSSRLDFAIGHLPRLVSQTEYAVLFEEDYVCMGRRRAGLPERPTMPLDTFVHANHVRVSSVEQSHLSLDDAFRSQRVSRNVALELSHFASVPSVLRVTDYLATLPRRLAEIFNESGQFVLYELPVKLPRVSITLHWHAHFAHDQGNQWFREFVSAAIGSFEANLGRPASR